jgi:phage shock protein A
VKDRRLEEATQKADAALTALSATREKLAELAARHDEAKADLQQAEDAVRTASAGLADPREKNAAETFHAASRKRAEMEARCKAFSETIIPDVLGGIVAAEADHQEALRGLGQVKVRLLAAELIETYRNYRRLAAETEHAAQAFEAAVDRVRRCPNGDGRRRLDDLIGPLTLVEAAPRELQGRFRQALGFVNPRNVEPILRTVFGMTEE